MLQKADITENFRRANSQSSELTGCVDFLTKNQQLIPLMVISPDQYYLLLLRS